MKRIVILGSTGSVGTQALDIVRANPDQFEVVGLSAHENTALFDAQVKEFHPKYIVQTAMSENPQAALSTLASVVDADLILNAISGHAGLVPTYSACRAGKVVALANKESLVMAGELIMSLAGRTGAKILPIDSEPSAIWQMIDSSSRSRQLRKVILTASGGPFWKWKEEELRHVSIAQALKHPTWKMGEKISIDSATLMNKAFEIIETRWLFDLPPEKIDVVVHRQSVVHSFAQWEDGYTSAILSPADMHIPIGHALFYPSAAKTQCPELDFSQLQLTFEKPDYSLFKGPRLAYDILKEGGIMPAAFCMADEIAVEKFLKGEIPFLGIYDFIERALEKVKNDVISMEAISELRQKFL